MSDLQPNSVPTPATPKRGRRKVRQGVVISTKMTKTIRVRIDRTEPHPLYGRIVRTYSVLVAHDEREECHEGDVVKVMETRPLSKTKCWRLTEIVERAR